MVKILGLIQTCHSCLVGWVQSRGALRVMSLCHQCAPGLRMLPAGHVEQHLASNVANPPETKSQTRGAIMELQSYSSQQRK